MTRTKIALCALPVAVLLAGCSSSGHSSPTAPPPSSSDSRPTIALSGVDTSKIPTCQSLVGKPLPAGAADSGCVEDNNIRGTATYTCKDGSTLVAFAGLENQTYYWAAAGQPVRSGTWQVGNQAATTC
jgi:hypothetical protein